MIGLGTIINVGCIILGGILGLFLGKKIKPDMQTALQRACALAVMFLGIAGALEGMISIVDGSVKSGGTYLVVGCLIFGTLIGELCHIEQGFNAFGEWLKRKTHSESDNTFVEGFVDTTFTICIGAMAIVGAINDGIYGDFSTLLVKGILDFIMVAVMTGAKGKGCIFSAIPVLVLQGGITILSTLISPYLNDLIMLNISTVGSILIFCVGANLVFGKKFRVANMLPALVLAVICAFIPFMN